MNSIPRDGLASGDPAGGDIPNKMTAATTILQRWIGGKLWPHRVAVMIDAPHGCMTGRGVRPAGAGVVTRRLLGCFLDDPGRRRDVRALRGY